MRLDAAGSEVFRLSPPAPARARVLSLAAAIAVHAAMALIGLLFSSEPMEANAPAIEIALIVEEAPEPASAPSGAVETASEPAAPPESIEPAPAIAEAAPPDVPAEAVEPPREIAPAPLPPPPPRRPVLPSPPSPPTASVPAPAAQSADPARAVAIESPVVAVVPPPAAAIRRAEADYVGVLLGWLEHHKEYPRAARLRRIQGTAIVRLGVLADGRLAALSLARSSGHAILDDASLDMVRRAAPLPRPPGGAIELDVPVVFEQAVR
jgi:protein TonB